MYVQCKGNHEKENIYLLNILIRINYKNQIKCKNKEVCRDWVFLSSYFFNLN